ncbi:MAG: COG2426 family protein [Methanohalobium sp.]|uniref:COG2426 family protein n=1 Tax=Methanohalobium sp. TaxID=2837493 RepID=UPI00397E026A
MPLEKLFVQLFDVMPSWLSTFLLSALPFSELRGSIPVALVIYNMDPVLAYCLGVLGNMFPVIPILLFLSPVSAYLRRFKSWDYFFTWLFARTHRRHSEKFEKYGTLALVLFVAIPLPVTGAWTGCVAAFVFGIKFRHALMAIFSGVLISGVIVTTLVLSGIGVAGIVD